MLIDDLGVSPDRWRAYNVTQWGHLRVRFGDDGSGQLGFKVETKSGGARDYWNTVTDVYKRGDGELVHLILKTKPLMLFCRGARYPLPLRRPSRGDAGAALLRRRRLPVNPSPAPAAATGTPLRAIALHPHHPQSATACCCPRCEGLRRGSTAHIRRQPAVRAGSFISLGGGCMLHGFCF